MTGLRVLLYSHDSFGLGHIRRSLKVAHRLSAERDVAAILVVTGSPYAQRFPFPARCDAVRLPGVTKDDDGRYRSSALPIGLGELVELRAGLIRSAAASFRPDIILVDHTPLGMGGELRQLFDELSEHPVRPRLVLGLRDIIDDPDVVERDWDRQGVWDALADVYDRVLVYGDPAVLTTAQELGLAARFPGKVGFVGYVGGPEPPTADRPRAGQRAQPRVVVTVGGGGDGEAVLAAYADVLGAWNGAAPFRSQVIAGPFLHDLGAHRRRLRATGQPVEVYRFVSDAGQMLEGAAGAVTMAGYNTVVEVLSAHAPALLVPRQRPRREQAIRAERLRSVADVEHCVAGPALRPRMAAFVRRCVDGPQRARRVRLNLDGAARVAAELRGARSTVNGGESAVLLPSA